MPGLPGIDAGLAGFSWKPVMRQLLSTCITPRLWASATGTSTHAIDMRALRQKCSASILP